MPERRLFSEEHDIFRESVRRFVEKEIVPHRETWEKDGKVAREWLVAWDGAVSSVYSWYGARWHVGGSRLLGAYLAERLGVELLPTSAPSPGLA